MVNGAFPRIVKYGFETLHTATPESELAPRAPD
jgi:hypothetical protein